MTGSNKLTKRDYLKTFLRAFFLQNGFNYSNYQGLGYANVMYPALKKHYGEDQEGFYRERTTRYSPTSRSRSRSTLCYFFFEKSLPFIFRKNNII